MVTPSVDGTYNYLAVVMTTLPHFAAMPLLECSQTCSEASMHSSILHKEV